MFYNEERIKDILSKFAKGRLSAFGPFFMFTLIGHCSGLFHVEGLGNFRDACSKQGRAIILTQGPH